MKSINWLWCTVLAFIFIAFQPLIAFAQDAPPETVEEGVTWLGKLVEALISGNWQVAGGIVLMIGMVAVRQYGIPKWGIKAELLPLILLAISTFSMLGLGVATGASLKDAAYSALEMALTAGGLWSMLGKYLTKLILGENYQAAEKIIET